MITMGKVDTSDLMMIITWAIDISFQSLVLKWAKSLLVCLRILVVVSGTRTVVIGIPIWLPGFVANVNYRVCYPMRKQCGLLCSEVYPSHYNDVIMSVMASQIISLTIVYLIVYSVADKKKTSELRVTSLWCGEVTGDRWIPAQMASNGKGFHLMTSSWL